MIPEHCDCGEKGTWLYMPKRDCNGYYCDDCVPRGCVCNEEEDGTQSTDEQGRMFPCCEFFAV